MGRAALIAVVLCAAGRAGAAPLSLQLGVGGGVGWASRAGAYRDDNAIALRAGLGVGALVAIDLGLAEDLERVEPAVGAGVRVRLGAGPCWVDGWSPYLRGAVSVVGGSHLGSNYDLLAGAGHWGRLVDHVAWFAELDAVARVGEVDTWSLRLEAGLAVTSVSFWQ